MTGGFWFLVVWWLGLGCAVGLFGSACGVGFYVVWVLGLVAYKIWQRQKGAH